MSTNTKQATVAAEPAAKERKRGMQAVRESELWHLGALISDALEEGAFLTRKVYDGASAAYLARRDPEAEVIFDEAERERKLEEALICAETAEHYLRMVLDQVPFSPDGDETAGADAVPEQAAVAADGDCPF